MNTSKQFIPKHTSISPLRHSNVKVWGQQTKRPTSGLDRANSNSQDNKFKSFIAQKDKISKIFAPKLTVIDQNISIGNKQEINLDANESANWQNPHNKSNRKSYESINEVPRTYEVNEKIQSLNEGGTAEDSHGFFSPFIPRIKIGKFTFGGSKINNISPSSATDERQPFQANPQINFKSRNKKEYDPESIFNKLNSNIKQDNKANFFHQIKVYLTNIIGNWWDSIKFDFYGKQWFRRLNYQYVAFDIPKNINRLIACLCIFSFIGFFTYLSFFDQYFTIKKYTVQYINGSYLNNQQTIDLITHFQKNKLYKVFPNNQYWFANNLSLTASAKEIFPEIKNVNIKNRQWPDKVLLQVETNKPILTLWVTENNEQKYWRINENGKISSQDKAGIWYNIVKVEKPYAVQGGSGEQVSLFNHSFENEPSQRQRFKLTKKLLDYFKQIDISISSTTFPSISDTDIIMESSKGTKFLFDSLAFDNDLQIARLDYFLKSKTDKNDYYELHQKGLYSYFDFRVAHKAHICKISEKCNLKPEDSQDKK